MYSFPNLEPVCCSMSSSNCCFLAYIQISQESGKVAWYAHLSKNFPQFVVIHTKVMFKILQARLQQYVNHKIPDVQAGFRKGRGTRDQIANICWSSKKQDSSRKTSISALLTMPKPLTVWITINCGKFWQRWEYQTTWSASWEIWMQVRKQQLELDVEQQTGSKPGKEYVKAIYCHPANLIYMQSTSCEMLGWSWNQDCQEKYE